LALVPFVELVYQDESGSAAALKLFLAASSTVAAAVSASDALAAAVAPITGGVLVRRRIVYQMRPDDPGSPEAGTSIKRQGVFFFDCGSAASDAIVTVPGIRDELLVTSGPSEGVEIDATLSAITTFVDELIADGATNPFAEAITSLVLAYRQSRV
jgi:hypothetical protein